MHGSNMNVTLILFRVYVFGCVVIVACNTRNHVVGVVAFTGTPLVSTTILSFVSKRNSHDLKNHRRQPILRCRVYTTIFARSTASPFDSSTKSNDHQDRALARQYIQEGMQAFRIGDVSKSIEYFDLAEENDKNITPYLWQRGLSYYYNEQFDMASQQFRIDVSVNPYDVEEIVWDIASQLRYNYRNRSQDQQHEKDSFPIMNQLSLPPGSNDRRRIMGYVYKLFRGEGTEHDLALAGTSKDGSLSDEFYALFYLALFNEAFNRQSAAELYLRRAIDTIYGKQSNDYMVSCAKLQAKLRNWT